MSFTIITLDGNTDSTAGSPSIGQAQIVVAAQEGFTPQPVSRDNPLPVSEGFAASGVAPVLHNFNVAPSQSPVALTPLPGRPFNVDLVFTNDCDGVMTLVRSFDGGATWSPLTANGQPVGSWAASASEHFNETEVGVEYALQMTNRTAGSVAARMSQ